MIKHLIVLILLVLANSSIAQNISIDGSADHQPNKLVRVITYADLFSNLEKNIGDTKTDDNGNFSLQIESSVIQFAYLALGLDRGEFYLTPGTKYNFTIPIDTSAQKGSIFDRLPLRFNISSVEDGVQKAIEDFNLDYNDFVYNNVNSIYRSRDKSVVMGFVAEMRNKYGDNKTEFVIDYVEYSLASLLWLSRKQSNAKILVNYFINKPVLYDNIQYADFFKEFFKSYFDSEKTFRYEDLLPSINQIGSVSGLADLVNRDTLIAKDSRISEIVIMQLLSRYYFDRYVNGEKVIEKLSEIATKSEYEENRRIAMNYIVKLQELQGGTMAPQFSLLNSSGDTLSLSDYMGKFVLLSFVIDECSMCEFHMPLLDDLEKQLGFEMLLVVAGDNVNNISSYASDRGYTWPIIQTGDNILVLEDYNIKAYPSYILINPDGTVAYVHLPMPEENMELYIKRFMDKYNSQ